jgi:hypothetical protein
VREHVGVAKDARGVGLAEDDLLACVGTLGAYGLPGSRPGRHVTTIRSPDTSEM